MIIVSKPDDLIKYYDPFTNEFLNILANWLENY